MHNQASPISEQQLDEDDQDAIRTAWLLSLTPEQVIRFDSTTIYDWLAARNEQRRVRLAAACRTLREQCARRERAHARLVAALTAARTAT